MPAPKQHRRMGVAYFTPTGAWRIDRFIDEEVICETLQQYHGFCFNPQLPDLLAVRDRLFRLMLNAGIEPAQQHPRNAK